MSEAVECQPKEPRDPFAFKLLQLFLRFIEWLTHPAKPASATRIYKAVKTLVQRVIRKLRSVSPDEVR